MIREFAPSCEGCVNKKLLDHFADRCEVLEKVAARESINVVAEGRIGCKSQDSAVAETTDEDIWVCQADAAAPPRLSKTLVSAAGLTATAELVIQGDVPELVGMPLMGGGLHVTARMIQEVNDSLAAVDNYWIDLRQ